MWSLLAGTKLDGYEILGPLGSGGMGEVYRARDSILKREVAIKVLPPFVSQNADRLRRFEQEAQAAAALNHPNILAVHQFGVFEGAPYLVSELLEGGSLRQQLGRGPLPIHKTIEYGVQIAHGVAAAHEKGIVHRDLKPENIFVTKDGRVKILDFGLAKLTEPQPDPDAMGSTMTHRTEPGMIMGTAGYMSPEQVRGKMVDHRADIFAFGAILYEMLAGKPAFQRSTSADTMSAVLNEDPPRLSEIVQSTPPGLQRIVHRCLEKNAEQRFQSGSDLAFALEALSDPGISSGVVIPALRHRRRSKVLVWSTSLVAVVLLAAIAYVVLAERNSVASLRISNYVQITHDGHVRIVRGTDGSRIYFVPGNLYRIGEVATSGGEIASVPVALSNPVLMDLSPDGSTFLVASYTGGTTISHTLWSARILGGSVRYLATGAEAAWSPDGSAVAYSSAGGDINLVRSNGIGAHKLASVGGLAQSLSWSPDGSAIRFSKDDVLWEISSSGSNLHRLLSDWRADQCCGRWAPDGNLFYFVSNGQIWARDERHGLFRKSSAQPVQLTSGPIHWGRPIPSKNGKTIFAPGFTRHGQLIRFDYLTKQFQPYLAGLSADNLSFSKDGQSVAYVSYPEGILWRANRDGSGRVQLSDAPIQPAEIHWSPDGTQIVFVDYSQDTAAAYIISSQGGGPRRLLPQDTGSQTDPNWSPDGRKIVFSNSPPGGADPNSVIRVLDLDSKRVATLPESAGMFSPRWSPDGRSIAAVRMNSTTLNIFDVQTQQWSTPYQGVVSYLAWSKDSHWIYFLDFQNDPSVFRVRVTDGAAERITDLKDVHYTGNSGMWMGLDPTEAPLFLRDLGTHDIYALALEQK